jgi:DNA-directed RNA polymerase
MQTIAEYQDARRTAVAVQLQEIPEVRPFARKHVEKLTEQGYASLVLRQLAREAQSSRRTHDLDSLDKHAKAFKVEALKNGLAAFTDALDTAVIAGKYRRPLEHFGKAKNPVNALAIEAQAALTWETVCSALGRMAMADRPLSVQTLAKMLGRCLKAACGGCDEYRTLGYERAALSLLDFFCAATQWVEEVQGEYNALRKRNQTNSYRLTEKFLEDVLGGALACDFSERRPMLVPPVPWTETAKHGGYLHNGIQAIRDVRTPVHSSEVVAALNALQATPFRVNQRILDVARSFRVNAEDFGARRFWVTTSRRGTM